MGENPRSKQVIPRYRWRSRGPSAVSCIGSGAVSVGRRRQRRTASTPARPKAVPPTMATASHHGSDNVGGGAVLTPLAGAGAPLEEVDADGAARGAGDGAAAGAAPAGDRFGVSLVSAALSFGSNALGPINADSKPAWLLDVVVEPPVPAPWLPDCDGGVAVGVGVGAGVGRGLGAGAV